MKGLSALNLDGNPLDHPPFEIVKQGIKAIQQYLRDQSDENENVGEEEEDDDDDEQQATDIIADVWGSSDEDHPHPRQRSRSLYPSILPTRPSVMRLRNSKYKSSCSHMSDCSPSPFGESFLVYRSEIDCYETSTCNPLTTHLQSCIHLKRVSYSEMRLRPPQRPKSELKLPRV